MPFDLLAPGAWLLPPVCPTLEDRPVQVHADPDADIQQYVDDDEEYSDDEDADGTDFEPSDYLNPNSLAQHVDEYLSKDAGEYIIHVCMFRTQRVLGPMFVQYALQKNGEAPTQLSAPTTTYSALRHPDWVPETEGSDDVDDASQRQTAFVNTCAAVVAETFPQAAMKVSYTQRFRGYVPSKNKKTVYAFFDCTFDHISDTLPAQFKWAVIADITDATATETIEPGLREVFAAKPELAGPAVRPTLLYFCRTPNVVGTKNNMVVPHVYDPNIGRAHCFTRKPTATSRRAAAFDSRIVPAGANGERALVKSADDFIEI